jgi:hypothetical protein
MRAAENKLGATGAEHIAMALRELTGLQRLHMSLKDGGTFLISPMLPFLVFVVLLLGERL